MTLWAARQHFEEGSKGSIEVGKLADLVILDRDPTTGDPETIDQIEIVETIKEGVTVYARGKAGERKKTGMLDGLDRRSDGFGAFLASASGGGGGRLGAAMRARFAGEGLDGPACSSCACGTITQIMASMVDGEVR